jgi:hypothetical protein
MINKKILIVTEDFWPKKSPRSHRATELAVGLLNQGFEVHVLGDQNIEITESIEKQIGVKIFSFPKNKFFGLKPNNIFKLLFWYLGYFIFRSIFSERPRFIDSSYDSRIGKSDGGET